VGSKDIRLGAVNDSDAQCPCDSRRRHIDAIQRACRTHWYNGGRRKRALPHVTATCSPAPTRPSSKRAVMSVLGSFAIFGHAGPRLMVAGRPDSSSKQEPGTMRYELNDYEWRLIKPMLLNKPRRVPQVDGWMWPSKTRVCPWVSFSWSMETVGEPYGFYPNAPLLLLQSLQSPFLLGRGQEVAVLLAALEARGFCLRRLDEFLGVSVPSSGPFWSAPSRGWRYRLATSCLWSWPSSRRSRWHLAGKSEPCRR
jgi:hypothetical protein